MKTGQQHLPLQFLLQRYRRLFLQSQYSRQCLYLFRQSLLQRYRHLLLQ